MITKPQNVFVLRDIMANGYRAGGNAKFFAEGGDLNKAVEKMQQRLNFEDADRDEVFPSLLAFPMAVSQVESMHNEISVTSRLLPWDVHSTEHNSFPGGKDMYGIYKDLLQLEQVHFGEDLRASENMEYMSQVRRYHPIARAIAFTLSNPFATHRVSFDCVHRARRTTPSASPARTAPTIRSPAATRRSCRAWATGAPTPAREMPAGAAARPSP